MPWKDGTAFQQYQLRTLQYPTGFTSHYPQPVVSGWSMRRFEKLDLDIMSRGNFIANNELNSALSGSFLNSTGVHQRSSLDHRISNKIQVSLTGGEEYETWMNFANNAAVLTMSNTFAIFYLLTVMHITDRSHYNIIGFYGFSHVQISHSHVRAK